MNISQSPSMHQSLQIFKGGPLDLSYDRSDKVTRKSFLEYADRSSRPTVFYNPPEISKVRSVFENNRSKVNLSNLSNYGRQIMFPTLNPKNSQSPFSQISQSFHNSPTNENEAQTSSPQKMYQSDLYLDNKQKKYYEQVTHSKDKWTAKKNPESPVAVAGKFSYRDEVKGLEKRHYRYQKAPHAPQGTEKFHPFQLNLVDEMKGILG